MKILNLYAGIGGNRTLWEGVEVTAVEIEPALCEIYQDRFPHDEVICGDAHEYLLQHHDEYDFVWSSPPCQTHSQLNIWGRHENRRYPDMSLYQQIIRLREFHKGKWVVENVRPYYGELIQSQAIGRHRFWANFHISAPDIGGGLWCKEKKGRAGYRKALEESLGFKVDKLPAIGSNEPLQIYRNCCHPEIGKAVLDSALGVVSFENMQGSLLDDYLPGTDFSYKRTKEVYGERTD